MTPEQYRQLMARFDALCDAAPEEQAAGVEALRAEHPELADELALMLAADAAESTAPNRPARRCPTCGDSFPDDVDFCPRHGVRLTDPSRSPTAGLVGEVLDGRFRVDALLGQGGMARVYRGRQLNVDREVAIKVLHEHLAAHDVVQRRFEREARIIAGLRHPNTLKLIDFGHTPSGALYIVSPLLEGEALDAVLKARGPLGIEATLGLLRQVAGALGEAHERGIVHRDLKPGNIFVESVGGDDVFKVLDFGVAQWRGGTEHQTDTGVAIGTPTYMSPEQIEAAGSLDGRSDLYSLGVVAYACLTGELPWQNTSNANMALKHLHEPPRPFADVDGVGAVPPPVEALVRWMLEKQPADRPADVHALRAALDGIAAGTWTGPGGASTAPARRHTGRWLGAALALVGVVVALALALGSDDAGPTQPADAAAPTTMTREPDAAASPDVGAEPDAAPPDAAVPDAARDARIVPPDAAQPDAARRSTPRPERNRPRPSAPKKKDAGATGSDYVPAPGLY